MLGAFLQHDHAVLVVFESGPRGVNAFLNECALRAHGWRDGSVDQGHDRLAGYLVGFEIYDIHGRDVFEIAVQFLSS